MHIHLRTYGRIYLHARTHIDIYAGTLDEMQYTRKHLINFCISVRMGVLRPAAEQGTIKGCLLLRQLQQKTGPLGVLKAQLQVAKTTITSALTLLVSLQRKPILSTTTVTVL